MPVELAIVTFVVLIFTCLLGLTIAIYALYRIFWKNASELKRVDKLTVDTAVSCIILHAITVLLDPIGYWFWASNNELVANIIWLIWDIFWTLSKLNLYFVYIYRCYITFKDTKYAYSPQKVYIPLAIAWFLQLINMIIFMLHELDDIDAIPDPDNPLADDRIVTIAASIYLVLDLFIMLAIVFLFVNPIVKLMGDLRDKSKEFINVDTLESIESDKLIEKQNNGHINVINENEEDSSSSSMELSTEIPHSPTKMGAAYNSNKRRKKHAVPQTPTTVDVVSNGNEISSTNGIVEDDDTSSMGSNLFKMKFGRLPCPEDEEEKKNLKAIKEGSKEDTTSTNKRKKFGIFSIKSEKVISWNEKQKQILNTGTRLALLSVVSLSSGFIYQFLWILSVALDRMGNFAYTWGIDTVINIICIYLSFQFAEQEYNMLCSKKYKITICCHCHGCCYKCIEKRAMKLN